MIITKKPMDVWIREAMTDPDKDAEITSIVLVHMVGGTPKPIHKIQFGKGKSYQPDTMASVFRGNAESVCQALSNTQIFQLMAFYGNRSEPEKFMSFSMPGGADMDETTSEPPTEDGQRRQMMRWDNNLLTQVYRRQNMLDETFIKVLQQQNQMVAMQNERIRGLMEENMEAVAIVKQIMVEQETKTHEHRMSELEYHRKTQEREKLLKMAPPLINRITGREVFPQATEDSAIIEAVAEHLPMEKVMELAGSLPPEVVGMLMSRFSQAIEKKQKEAEERKRLAASGVNHPDPEADAGGD